MKEFRTAAKAAVDPDDTIPAVVEFKVDEDVYTAHRPKTAAWLFLATAYDSRNPFDSMIEISKFLDSVLPDDQAERLTARLRDAGDPFELTDMIEIFNHLMAEFTGRPTTSQPG